MTYLAVKAGRRGLPLAPQRQAAGWRSYEGRYENTLRQLPKQTEPFALPQISITRGFAGGIREGLVLGRGFGVTRTQILEAINWGTFYGGHESLNLVDEVAGDVLDSWPA